MVDVTDDGLFIIEGDEVVHVHSSSSSEDDIESLNEYIEEWELEINE